VVDKSALVVVVVDEETGVVVDLVAVSTTVVDVYDNEALFSVVA